MNKEVTDIIFKHLSKGITSGYDAGLNSVMKRLKKKKFKITVSHTLVDKKAIDAFRREAFLVAGVGSYELEEKLKELAIEIIVNQGQDFSKFEPLARKTMLDYGIGLEEQAPSGWLKTNLYTATNTSYKSAEWNRLHDPDIKHVYPAYEYKTQGDDHVREEHQALEGLVALADDPIWDTIFPPNDWNCRCYVNPLDSDETENSDVMDIDRSEEQDKNIIKNVAPEFRRNAGKDLSIWGKWLDQKYSDLPKDVRQEIVKGLKGLK